MPQQLDFKNLRQAVEGRDVERMLSFYADDAELEVVNKNNPPTSPRQLRGKEQIRGYLEDVFSRDMTHHIEDEVVGENRVAYHESCQYPDGTRVLGARSLELRDGRIQRQVELEVWDE